MHCLQKHYDVYTKMYITCIKLYYVTNANCLNCVLSQILHWQTVNHQRQLQVLIMTSPHPGSAAATWRRHHDVTTPRPHCRPLVT